MAGVTTIRCLSTIALVLALGACGERRPSGGGDAAARDVSASDGVASDSARLDGPGPDAGGQRFSLRFYDQRLTLVSDYAELLARTSALPASALAVELHEEDIARYLVDEAPSRRVQLELTPAAQKRWAQVLGAMEELHPFVVSLDGKRLYAGLVYNIQGAAALVFPVLGVDGLNKGQLQIGATMGAWQGWGGGKDPAKIDRAELRQLFDALGVLGKLEP